MSFGTTVDFDRIKPSDIENSVDGLTVIRGFTIRYPSIDSASTAAYPIGTGISDPNVLLNAMLTLSGLTTPVRIGKPFPAGPSGSPANAGNLLLTKIRITSISSDTKMIGGQLFYYTPLINGVGQAVISFNSSFTTQTIETSGTYGGAANLSVWYQSGTPPGTTTAPSGPSGAATRIVTGQKSVSTGTLIVKIPFGGTNWNSLAPTYKSKISFINSDSWGSDTRGTWLFNGAEAQTNDFGNSYIVTFTFSYDPLGWYVTGAWTEDGYIPNDVDTVANLLATGLPAAGGTKNVNGRVRGSVQGETAFSGSPSGLFPWFTPAGILPFGGVT